MIPIARSASLRGFTLPAGMGLAAWIAVLTAVWMAAMPRAYGRQSPAGQTAPPAAQAPAAQPAASQAPVAAQAEPTQTGAIAQRPIAIVPLDANIAGAAAEVTGGLQVLNGRAFIASSGAVTAGSRATEVTLPYRGTLKVCTSTTVKLSADTSVPAGDVPGLLIAMDHGAIEASLKTGPNADIVLTPDFRILIGGPGTADLKVRLGRGGDTCVDNAGANAPYVVVTGLFDNGLYRVQPGQRVLFEHGSLNQVVDNEKEPCGCPAPPTGSNAFPLAQSEGLEPLAKPAPAPPDQSGAVAPAVAPLVYSSAEHAPKPAPVTQATAVPAPGPPPNPAANSLARKKKPGFFRRIGRFFKRVFGAE